MMSNHVCSKCGKHGEISWSSTGFRQAYQATCERDDCPQTLGPKRFAAMFKKRELEQEAEQVRALQPIHSQPVPVEDYSFVKANVLYGPRPPDNQNPVEPEPVTLERAKEDEAGIRSSTIAYIESMQSELQRESYLHKLDHSLADQWQERAEKAEAERDKCKRIAWDWGQGVTDAETAIRQLHKLFPIDAELIKEVEK